MLTIMLFRLIGTATRVRLGNDWLAAVLCSAGGGRTAEVRMPKDFACPRCDSPSIVYPEMRDDDGHVVCGGCGKFLATCGQFRRLVEQRERCSAVHTSGC
jgi:hypothetical protein